MNMLRNDETLSVFQFLNRDSSDALQLTTRHLKCFVAECMNDVCLRYFDHAELSQSYSSAELSFTIRGVDGSVCVKETKPEKAVDFLKTIPMFAKYLRMASVRTLSMSNCSITPELVNAMNSVSVTISVNKLAFSWIRLEVEFDVFHVMVLGFRMVQDMYILTTYADCVNDTLLTGLATKGNTKFEQAASMALSAFRAEEDRPRCGVSEDALLEFCFGERLSGGQKDRCVKLNYMHVSNGFFARVIHRSRQYNRGKDVEMEIKTTSRVIPEFPPELQLTPVVQGRDDGESVYNYSFEDGNPRKVTVRLVFHDVHVRGPVRPCYRMSKRLPGRFYREKLVVIFT